MSGESRPEVPYWHLWTDADGISHQDQCAFSDFELGSIGGGADPQWKGRKTSGRMTTMMTVLPVGWVGEWHENPKPQWIIPLSGCWSVESMDGTRVEFRSGDVSFGGDQGCKQRDGHKGHRSTTVGDVPAVLMLVQFEDVPPPESPCAYK